MTIPEARKKYNAYIKKYALPRMPDRGYGITGFPQSLRGSYTAFFKSKTLAITAGQLLANHTRMTVELGQILDHGNNRFTIGEITPD
jgi:hypothetical protein